MIIQLISENLSQETIPREVKIVNFVEVCRGQKQEEEIRLVNCFHNTFPLIINQHPYEIHNK